MILFISEISDLKQYFYQHFYEFSENPSKLSVHKNTCWRTVECSYSIEPHVDVVGSALSRRSVLCGNPPPPPEQLRVAGGYFAHAFWDGHYLWSTYDIIYLGNGASFVFFSALTFFFIIFIFYSRSVTYIASSKKKNWQNWKFSSHGVPLKSSMHNGLVSRLS